MNEKNMTMEKEMHALEQKLYEQKDENLDLIRKQQDLMEKLGKEESKNSIK